MKLQQNTVELDLSAFDVNKMFFLPFTILTLQDYMVMLSTHRTILAPISTQMPKIWGKSVLI